jgi:hypothetical protein
MRKFWAAGAAILICLTFGGLPVVAQTTGDPSRADGGPDPDSYLDALQRHLAIEYPEATVTQPIPDTILTGLQRRLSIEYPEVTGTQPIPMTYLDELQTHLAIEYPRDEA